MIKRKAIVDQKYCVACGCCAKVCPKSATAIQRGIYAVIDESLCIGCGKCKAACPASVIEMREAAE